MMFKYKVINQDMLYVEDLLEASDYESAKGIIQGNQWQLISLKEARGLDNLLFDSRGKVKLEAVSAFCSQLAMMIRTGANMVRGLEILQDQMEDRRLKEIIAVIIQEVSRGNSLSAAMRATRGALPDLLQNLVAVGEESGSLDSVLISMSEYYERENFIRKKIASASIYPIMMTVVLVCLVIFFMGFILPSMMDLIQQNGQSLPAITQLIIDMSNFFTTYWWILGLVFGSMAFGLNRIIKILKYRYYYHRFLLSLPLLGKNMKEVIIARFTRTLALFLHSSIPIITILNSLENIVGNEVPRLAIARARERVIRGEPIASAFSQEDFFDPIVMQMISIGEETGRLEDLMGELANNYDKRVEIGLARLVAMVEPVFTIIIGIFAGGLIISIALPIFNMSGGIK